MLTSLSPFYSDRDSADDYGTGTRRNISQFQVVKIRFRRILRCPKTFEILRLSNVPDVD